jgi:uncharacterized protein (TIGR02996 family)
LQGIAAAPLDPHPKWVYADWLDDQGEYDEATEQRRWTREMLESRAWLTEFAGRLGGPEYYGDEGPVKNGPPLTYETLMEAAKSFADRGEYFHMGSNESYKGEYGKFDEFWRHYEVVTGAKPENTGGFFSCSC